MRYRSFLRLCPLLVLLASVPAANSADPARFYARGAEGWFWYAEEPPEPETPEPESPPLVPTPPVLEAPPPIAKTIQPAQVPVPPAAASGPAPLSAAWLRANLERFRDQAIDDPSPRNVALYLDLQRLVLDKAERFAEATQRAIWADPLLDETTRRPLATFAANLVNREDGAANAKSLR